MNIRPVRVLDITGSGSFFDVAQGILYAAGLPASDGMGGTVTAPSRAAVINMSLGGGNVSVMASAVTAATNAGSLIIASAGNGATNSPSYPAAYPEVLSAVAIGPDLQLANYTNVGATVSLSAPGGDFRSGGGGAGIASTTWNFITGAANYAFYTGTSMAAPHVVGVAALVLAANPGMTAAQLRARLQNTATDIGAPGRDDKYGYGIVNAYNALRNIVGPARATYVRILDATTGDTVRTVATRADGSYSVSRVAPGSYYVVAGEDETADKQIGLPGRRFGWFGTATGPSAVSVSATQSASVSFTIGMPVESKPNNTTALANRLVVNGYVAGTISTVDPVAFFSVQIPRAGTYTFETSGMLGTCGFGLELDTQIDLFDNTNVLRASNDDATTFGAAFPPTTQLCSQIRTSLTPGTYFVRVRGSRGSVGQYRLSVRDQ